MEVKLELYISTESGLSCFNNELSQRGSRRGRRGGSNGWGQLFLINCFHVIDGLNVFWLDNRWHRAFGLKVDFRQSLRFLVYSPGSWLADCSVDWHPTNDRSGSWRCWHDWWEASDVQMMSCSHSLSLFPAPVSYTLGAADVHTRTCTRTCTCTVPLFCLPYVSHIDVFNCVNKRQFILKFLLALSLHHSPPSLLRKSDSGCLNKNI